MKIVPTVVILVLIGAAGALLGVRHSTSEAETQAIHDVLDAYRDAWLRGDAEAVMGILAADAVLIPSGLRPIVGDKAIREFWWPPGSPPTKVVAMQHELDEVRVAGDLAYARGTGSLAFSYDDQGQTKTTSSTFTFLTILHRSVAGSWRISRRMWINLPTKE